MAVTKRGNKGKRAARTRKAMTGGMSVLKPGKPVGNNGEKSKSWKKNMKVVPTAGSISNSPKIGEMFINPLGKETMSANGHRNMAYLSQITMTRLNNPNTKAVNNLARQLEKSATNKMYDMGMEAHMKTMKNYNIGTGGNPGLAYKHNPNFNPNSKPINTRKFITHGEHGLGLVRGNPLLGHNQRIKYQIFNPNANYTNNPFNNPTAFGKKLGPKQPITNSTKRVLVLKNNQGPINTHL